MFTYWAEEMKKIEAFKVLSRLAEVDGQPIGIIGFTKTTEGVNLNFLKASSISCEEEYLDLNKIVTRRDQLKMGINQRETMPLWSRKIYFGSREVLVKGSQGNAVDMGQIQSPWLLAEALRQGWHWEPFKEMFPNQLNLTAMELDLEWSELDSILEEVPIRLERQEAHHTYMIEAVLDLPIEQNYTEPVELDLSEFDSDLQESISIYGIELRDIWQDFEGIYEHHRLKGTFSVEELEAFKNENEINFEKYCPRGMRFAVLTYETLPEISIECYSSEYLETVQDFGQSGSGSAMGIMFKSTGEVGKKGYPLKACVIQQPLLAETKSLKFEVFKLHRSSPMGDIVFS